MVPVIQQDKWLRWCEQQALVVEGRFVYAGDVLLRNWLAHTAWESAPGETKNVAKEHPEIVASKWILREMIPALIPRLKSIPAEHNKEALNAQVTTVLGKEHVFSRCC